VASLLLARTAAAEVFVETVLVETDFARWHRSADCPVLLAQPEALVQLVPDPGGTRACTICAVGGDADALAVAAPARG
jgi:hypothetical protein